MKRLISEVIAVKELISVFLSCALLLCFAACSDESGGTADESLYSNAGSSNSEQSKPESKPPAVSEPEGEVSEESSIPKESQPVISEPEGPEGETSYYMAGPVSENAAQGYRIVYTLPETVNVVSLITQSGVCAVYDGEKTRFYSTTTGEIFCTKQGKWDSVPCGDGFWLNDPNEAATDWRNAPMIRFNLTDSKNELEYIDYEPNHDHVATELYYLYETTSGKIYANYRGDYHIFDLGNGIFPCVECITVDEAILESPEADSLFLKMIEGKKYGLVSNNAIIVPFEYEYMREGMYPYYQPGVVMAVKDGKTYYIASDGTNLTPEGVDFGSVLYLTRALIFDDGQGYIIEFY